MEEPREQPQSPEENLAAKKDKLKKAVMLMLNFQRGQALEKNLLQQEEEMQKLTVDEIDYLLEFVRYLDNQKQVEGPLDDSASALLVENESNLKALEGKIGTARAQELKDFFKVKLE